MKKWEAGLDQLDADYIEEGNPKLVRSDDLVLQFRCKCSDDNCKARILSKLSVYQKIHLNRDNFIIRHDHQVDSIEKVLIAEDTYSVVKKNKSTTAPGKDLNTTK
jgi:hypothetical protein